jgi:hypothetical protein
MYLKSLYLVGRTLSYPPCENGARGIKIQGSVAIIVQFFALYVTDDDGLQYCVRRVYAADPPGASS